MSERVETSDKHSKDSGGADLNTVITRYVKEPLIFSIRAEERQNKRAADKERRGPSITQL